MRRDASFCQGVRCRMSSFSRELPSTLPSAATYRREVGRLVRTLRPLGVREWGVWNEANHPSQPTWRHPERAAAYFTAMRSICRGCTIVALDVLDLSDVAGDGTCCATAATTETTTDSTPVDDVAVAEKQTAAACC